MVPRSRFTFLRLWSWGGSAIGPRQERVPTEEERSDSPDEERSSQSVGSDGVTFGRVWVPQTNP